MNGIQQEYRFLKPYLYDKIENNNDVAVAYIKDEDMVLRLGEGARYG